MARSGWIFWFLAASLAAGCGSRSGDDWPSYGSSQRTGGTSPGGNGSGGVSTGGRHSGGTGASSDGGGPSACTPPGCLGCADCVSQCRCFGGSQRECRDQCEGGSTGGVPGTGGTPSLGDCCERHDWPGCEDWRIVECVCASDPFCCEGSWDNYCVDNVEGLGCGECGGGGTGGSPLGACCSVHSTPRCNDEDVSRCVCVVDRYCCDSEWDQTCVSEVDTLGCGRCTGTGGTGGTGGGAGSPGVGSCCEVHETPSCAGSAYACVCARDPYCCSTAWDQQCVLEVESFGCASCPNGTGGVGGTGGEGTGGRTQRGDCCEFHSNPGCDNAQIALCVCETDAYCCETQWDNVCVEEVTSLNCGRCDGTGGTGGGGTGGAPPTGECCEPHDSPGCNDPSINACVCQGDEYCCDQHWDNLCVQRVEEDNCGSCGGSAGAPGTGGTGGGGTGGIYGVGDCCEIQPTPACEDVEVADCVCAGDPYCCRYDWDALCVDEVDSLACGTCAVGGSGGTGGGPATGGTSGTGGRPDLGSCCHAHSSPGCRDQVIEECVCGYDAFCCDASWDDQCVQEVDSRGCGTCSSTGGSGGGGTGGSGGSGGSGGVSGTGGAPPVGDCCRAQSGPGCEEPDVSECVCAQDAYCCLIRWDERCVRDVEMLSCGTCGAMSTVDECLSLALDACENCLCTECFEQFSQCRAEDGCAAIYQCISDANCIGLDCYTTGVCREVVEANGGIYGQAALDALAVFGCAEQAACLCPDTSDAT